MAFKEVYKLVQEGDEARSQGSDGEKVFQNEKAETGIARRLRVPRRRAQWRKEGYEN